MYIQIFVWSYWGWKFISFVWLLFEWLTRVIDIFGLFYTFKGYQEIFKCFHFLVTVRLQIWKIMAASLDNTHAVSDGGKCSICYDHFKAPRYLPCKHSFCHDCLYTYIASHCNSTESRLGFHCPICRVYIPNTRATDNPKEWAKCFPKISFLRNMHTALIKYSVKLVYVRAKRKTQHIFVLIVTKKCARTAQNTTTEEH